LRNPGPCAARPRSVEFAFFDFEAAADFDFDGAAALPAMPAIAPSIAHTAITPIVRFIRFLSFTR
jgi:hypothetical protein